MKGKMRNVASYFASSAVEAYGLSWFGIERSPKVACEQQSKSKNIRSTMTTSFVFSAQPIDARVKFVDKHIPETKSMERTYRHDIVNHSSQRRHDGRIGAVRAPVVWYSSSIIKVKSLKMVQRVRVRD